MLLWEQSLKPTARTNLSHTHVEVVLTGADGAQHQRVEVPSGTTVAEAVAASRFRDAARDALGVYGELVPPERVLEGGERIDLLQRLLIDPMQARRQRAAGCAG